MLQNSWEIGGLLKILAMGHHGPPMVLVPPHNQKKTEPWDSAAQDGKKKCIHVVGPDFRDSFDDTPATEITQGVNIYKAVMLKTKKNQEKLWKTVPELLWWGHSWWEIVFPKDLP